MQLGSWVAGWNGCSEEDGKTIQRIGDFGLSFEACSTEMKGGYGHWPHRGGDG